MAIVRGRDLYMHCSIKDSGIFPSDHTTPQIDDTILVVPLFIIPLFLVPTKS